MPVNKPKRKAGNRKVVTKTAWKPGQSGNLKGAPKRGMSIKEAYDWALKLNAEDMAAILAAGGNNELADAFRRMPKGIELKTLWAARIVSAVMFEPQPGLVNHVTERLEGKVTQPIDVYDWRSEAAKQGYDPNKLYSDLVNAARARLVESGNSGSDARSDDDAATDSAAENAA